MFIPELGGSINTSEAVSETVSVSVSEAEAVAVSVAVEEGRGALFRLLRVIESTQNRKATPVSTMKRAETTTAPPWGGSPDRPESERHVKGRLSCTPQSPDSGVAQSS